MGTHRLTPPFTEQTPDVKQGYSIGSAGKVVSNVVLLMAAVLYFVFLRIYQIRREGMWLDEILSFPAEKFLTLNEYIRDVLAQNPPVTPAYFIIQYAWSRAFGLDITVLRILPMLLEFAGAAGAALLARAIYGARAGWLVFALCAVSLPHVYYAQELRMYALVLACVPVALLGAWRYVEGGNSAWLGVCLLADTLLAWSHLPAVTLAVPQFLYVIAYRPRPWSTTLGWFFCLCSLGISCVAWTASMDMEKTKLMTSWVGEANSEVVLKSMVWPSAYASFLPEGLQVWVAALVFGVLTIFVVFSRLRSGEVHASSRADGLLYLAMVAPSVLLGMQGIIGAHASSARYALFASYPLFILIGGAVSRLPRLWLRNAATIALCALLAVQGASLMERPFRVDWQRAAFLTQKYGTQRDLVICLKRLTKRPMKHYSGLDDGSLLEFERLADAGREIRQALYEGGYVWLVMGKDDDLPIWPINPEKGLNEMYCESFEIPGRIDPVRLYRCRWRQPSDIGAAAPFKFPE